MPKKDYYDDPNAPTANSLVVAVAAIVRIDAGDILMIKRSDNGLWAPPGGAQDIGETTREAAVREVFEETGIQIRVVTVSGIYSDPRHVIEYDDGEVRQEFSIVFEAKPIGGELRESAESTIVRWISPREIKRLPMSSSVKLRIETALKRDPLPYLS
ncbi:MAG: NUDIX domain-containing protein [Pseudonocardia sp.]|nr:NUDIX domain-containing protein [Pseudonocardia sp.]